jgi:hypothetical protein
MKKHMVLIVGLVILFSSVFFVSCAGWGDPYSAERKNLASELGVNLSDYPQLGFPVNYFYEVLKPGMSSEEVHKMVIGYKAVFLCDGDSELYYYFSTDDNKADRYLIVYDAKDQIKYTLGEDPNSRELQNTVHNCNPGLLRVE